MVLFDFSRISTVLLIAILIGKLTSVSVIGMEQTISQDKINNDQMIWQSQVVSVLSCLRQSYRLTSGMSFYNELTNVCSLQSIVYLYYEQSELGYRYFVPKLTGKCTDGFMHNRALKMCYNFKCCQFYDAIQFGLTCNAAGTSLIKIDSAEKQTHMEAFLDQEQTKYTLIQGTRNETGAYLYEDGQMMTFFNWNVEHGEPEARPSEIYIILHKGKEFQWHDTRNTATYNKSNLVCEMSIV
ncbi:uncharacterized protein [Argopecten irradians]|uniref:uncharacterized protein n=1 Tax=Argopecten irradians TaxID=31199 RepID=UPI00371928E7